MCGITGIYAFSPTAAAVDCQLLDCMRDVMAHRGPDGGRTWVAEDRRIGLAFRRLAIIDLAETAMQPMSNEDGSVRLVFNGEIYNHAEIRAELERLGGHVWRTDHSDTEMIVHAFEQWGIDCIQRFRGMFALGIWDARRRSLWLVRDRIGIKPLYYTVRAGKLLFASEIKALLQDPEQKRAVHEESFYHYLSFLTTPAPQTLFDGIKKLPGGSWLRIDADGQISEQRYWEVWDHVQPLTEASEQEIAERLLAELRTAVKLRKVSDVPVGVFLSGGIDSSTNAALFSEGETQPIKTFSIGYAGEYQSYQNELHYARQMAQLVNADHHELLLTQDDLIDFLPRMVQLQDEPIADPVCVPVYYVSKLARDNGVIVCQVGEGSDELFLGYPHWKRMVQLQHYASWPGLGLPKQAAMAALRMRRRDHRLSYEYLRRSVAGQPIFWGGAEAFTTVEKLRLLSPRLRQRFADFTSWEAIRPTYQRFQAKAWEPSALHWMSFVDLNMRLPELLLMRVDKMSMGVGLEGRVPFLDHKFVELALGIPTAVKTRNGVLKSILKRAVRGLIPDELIDRPKQGFGVPVYEWFYDRLGAQAHQELDDFCRQTDFLDPVAVRRLYGRGHGSKLWYLLNFALWWKEYVR
jgi:asparagine synthase (glutamine-hydrolysing)